MCLDPSVQDKPYACVCVGKHFILGIAMASSDEVILLIAGVSPLMRMRKN